MGTSIRIIRKHYIYDYEKYLLMMFTFLDEEKLKQIVLLKTNRQLRETLLLAICYV